MVDNDFITGRYTIVKFRLNPDRRSHNRLITSTLGKYGVINSDWASENPDLRAPNPNEFWLVRCDGEIKARCREGLLVLSPVQFVPRKYVLTLLDGMFTEFNNSGIKYIEPKWKDRYWILPLDYRRQIPREEAHATIVLNYPHAIGPIGEDYPEDAQGLLPQRDPIWGQAQIITESVDAPSAVTEN